MERIQEEHPVEEEKSQDKDKVELPAVDEAKEMDLISSECLLDTSVRLRKVSTVTNNIPLSATAPVAMAPIPSPSPSPSASTASVSLNLCANITWDKILADSKKWYQVAFGNVPRTRWIQYGVGSLLIFAHLIRYVYSHPSPYKE